MAERVFLYARTATRNQAEPSITLERQLSTMREYAQTQKWVVAGEYVEEGVSGATDQRPELQRMVQNALSGDADLILVQDFSRLFRDTFLIEKYKRKLEKGGVAIRTTSEATGKFAPFARQLIIFVEERQESERAKQRQRRRIARKLGW